MAFLIQSYSIDIAKEEKNHVGEFLTLLQRKDREQEVELNKGKREVEELTGKYE